MKKYIFTIILLLSSLLISIALMEITLRIVNFPLVKSGWQEQNIDVEELNQLGTRGRNFLNEKDIKRDDQLVIIVGDSQVRAKAGGFGSFLLMPERRLEYYLNQMKEDFNISDSVNFIVRSIGLSGIGQDQELLLLERYFSDYKASRILLWFSPENDLWNNMFSTHWNWNNGAYKPTFWLDSNYDIVGPNNALYDDIGYSKVYILLNHFYCKIMDKLENTIPKYSFLGRFIHNIIPGPDIIWSRKYLPKSRSELGIDSCDDSDLKLNDISNFQTWGRENIAFEKSHFINYSIAETPRIKYSVQLTRRLIEKIEGLSLKQGCDFTVFTVNAMSDNYFYTQRIFPDVNVKYNLKVNDYCFEASAESFKKRTKQIMKGFNYFDIDISEIELPYVSEKDGHLNPKSNDIAMKKLALIILVNHNN